MATIYLFRHGQASFGAADYDQLSDKGCEQARILGAFWQGFSIDSQLYSGDLSRHIQTFENFQQGAKHKDMPITINAGFNELDAARKVDVTMGEFWMHQRYQAGTAVSGARIYGNNIVILIKFDLILMGHLVFCFLLITFIKSFFFLVVVITYYTCSSNYIEVKDVTVHR